MSTQPGKAPSGKLRESTVHQIRAMRGDPKKPSMTYQKIAEEVGVSIGTIYNVVTGKTWGWLESLSPPPSPEAGP